MKGDWAKISMEVAVLTSKSELKLAVRRSGDKFGN
jgi:hypothetical protein